MCVWGSSTVQPLERSPLLAQSSHVAKTEVKRWPMRALGLPSSIASTQVSLPPSFPLAGEVLKAVHHGTR